MQYQEATQYSIVFVVVFQDLKCMAYSQSLLNSAHNIFLNLFKEKLEDRQVPNEAEVEKLFAPIFNRKSAQLENETDTKSLPVEANNDNSARKKNEYEMKKKGAQSKQTNAPKKGKKQLRKWDDQITEEEQAALNYSSQASSASQTVDNSQLSSIVGNNNKFQKTGSGDVIISDLEMDPNQTISNKSASSAFSLFSNLIGGKYLKEEDLSPILKQMQEHLTKKNVANSIALELCESVKASLINKKVGSFDTVKNTVNKAFRDRLTQILTPSTSLDLLHSIRSVRKNENRPYTISLIGVNGVGKSTTLAKIAYWLLSNNFRILVAACDTFRSGAIEQLGVHVKNLQSLKGSSIELFAQGYGKDSSFVVKNAVEYAKQNSFDVILIDTAGRRHNDQRLMGSLEKFTKATKLDKIFQVAEALVGTDSLAQAKHFQASLYHRPLDGFIISKVDTVGQLVGVMVGMVYAVRVPIIFVGIGQTYSDLRTLSVDWVVDQLMK
ncbi:SRP54-type protein [Schizosaccharomyces pombe]